MQDLTEKEKSSFLVPQWKDFLIIYFKVIINQKYVVGQSSRRINLFEWFSLTHLLSKIPDGSVINFLWFFVQI